jgi:hypothetical protein
LALRDLLDRQDLKEMRAPQECEASRDRLGPPARSGPKTFGRLMLRAIMRPAKATKRWFPQFAKKGAAHPSSRMAK